MMVRLPDDVEFTEEKEVTDDEPVYTDVSERFETVRVSVRAVSGDAVCCGLGGPDMELRLVGVVAVVVMVSPVVGVSG
jgi:hypothetical protein